MLLQSKNPALDPVAALERNGNPLAAEGVEKIE
jgi:hypothetical protein